MEAQCKKCGLWAEEPWIVPEMSADYIRFTLAAYKCIECRRIEAWLPDIVEAVRKALFQSTVNPDPSFYQMPAPRQPLE